MHGTWNGQNHGTRLLSKNTDPWYFCSFTHETHSVRFFSLVGAIQVPGIAPELMDNTEYILPQQWHN
jgi:hypothetical protein